MTALILTIIVITLLYLILQRWFWLSVFGIGALASCFAVIASIIHFQILTAMGFYLLATVLGTITHAIDDI